MPRLGEKTNSYRPSTELFQFNNKFYDLREFIVAHWGFENNISASGIVGDLSGNGYNGTLAGAVSVSTNDYPGILPRGSLSFDATGVGTVINRMFITTDSNFYTTKPFSLSFWLKLSDVTVNNQAIIVALNDFQITYYSSNKLLGFRWYERDSPSSYFEYFARLPSSLADDDWVHVIFTYNGDDQVGELDPDAVVNSGEIAKFYFNGEIGRTYGSVKNSWSGNGIAADVTSLQFRVNAPLSPYFDSPVRSFGSVEWWSKVLNADEVDLIYRAQAIEFLGTPFNQSGFISRSPRLHIRELDDLPGAYSTIRRTGDPTRSGGLASNFDDDSTIIFSESGDVVFPSMLPRGSLFESQAVDVIGQESDISASLPIRSFQQPTYLHYSPTEDVGPFDENRAVPATSFFLNGTDPDVLPGFQSPIRSKAIIQIDMTPNSEVTLTRNTYSRNVAESQPTSPDNTGFYYYNFSRREWEQIGSVDPGTGGSLYYDYAIRVAASLVSGTFPNQFMAGNSSNRFVVGINDDIRENLGYSKIGSPSLTMGAPTQTKYHATSSQTLKMSDYISDPFLLEAVQIEFGEVKAQRTNGGTVASSEITATQAIRFASGSCRDIDNYVFFIYRQDHANRTVDSLADVSSSHRYLVCSASMAFWNSASLNSDNLLHTPAFSYNFNLPANNNYVVGAFTGSVKMQTLPAVAGPQHLGVFMVPTPYGATRKVGRIQGSWGGGTTFKDSNLVGVGPEDPIRPFDPTVSESLPEVVERAFTVDHRATRKFGGEVQVSETERFLDFGRISLDNPQSNPSPYLLQPNDELIFGLEAAIPFLTGSFLASNMTGSHVKVGTKPCKITLYGSLIKDSVEKLPTLNQDLSSNSVHEVVGNEPVLDQFQIEPRSSYYGSYVDEIVTGNMAILNPDGTTFTIYDQDNSRRVISRILS